MARHIEMLKDDNNNAADLYVGVLRMSTEGMTLDTMKSRLSIMEKVEKVEKSTGNLVLEDAEWRVLNDALKANKWPQVHPFIIDACDAVSGAEEKDAR